MAKYFFLALSLFTCLSAVNAGDADTKALADQWRQAEQLLTEGRAEQAYAIYALLLEARPGHNALMLGQARAAAAVGRAGEAASLYEVLINKFPNDPALRSEAAAAERAAGNADRADTLSVPPQAVDMRSASIAQLLPRRPEQRQQKPQPEKKRTFFTGRLRTGVIYDTNANQGPASEMFSLGNFTVTLPGVEQRSTGAAYAGAFFNFAHLIRPNSPWVVIADAGFQWRGNFESELRNNQTREWQWGRLAAGMRHVRGNNLFEFKFKGEVFDYQLANHVFSTGAEASYMRKINDHSLLITQAGVDYRTYSRSKPRDGVYGNIGQYGRFLFGKSGHSLLLGGRLLQGNAESQTNDYNGWEAAARLNFQIGKRLQASPHVSYTREHYKKPATVIERNRRKDDRWRAGMDLSCKINNAWTLEASYSYVDNKSAGLFNDYRQQVVSAGVSWGF